MFEEWQPDLVLINLRPPDPQGMDGFEVTRQIRASSAGQKAVVIAMTSSFQAQDQDQLQECGLEGCIRKPFTETDLFALLDSKLGGVFFFRDDSPPPAGGETGRSPLPNHPQDQPDPVRDASLTGLPAGLIEKIRRAAVSAYIEDLHSAIDEVGAISAPAADGLRKLANNYQYDALLQLFQEDG